MSSTAQFRVRIYGLSGTGLQLPSGESNIQLKVNFDGYKEFTTEARTLDANPSWSDDVEFQYHTRHARSLSQKRLRFTLQSTSSGFFRTSTRDWGEAVVDLHTLATGPVDHKNIRILDGSSPRGSLNFSVVMEQAITATVNFADVAITGNHAASQGQVMLQFAYTGHEKYTEKTVCTEAGGPRFAFLPQLRLSTVFSTFTSSSISFWLRGVTGSSSMGDVLASASLQTSNTPIFTDGKPSSFALTLHTPTGQAAGQMTGRMWYTQTPDYLQMAGGYHTEAGIYGASFVIPNLPDKPKCYVQGAASAPASQGRGRLAGLGAALVGARPQQPSPGARGGLSTGHLGAQIAVRALGRKLGGDSPAPGSTVVLPHAWDRRVDPKSGRAYFFNTATSTSTWQLPTQSTFEVSFMHAGPLGLELVRNWSGRRESGKPSGRRYSGQDRGAVVRSVAPGSQAAHVTTPQRIQPGMHLICINRGTTLQWDLATTLGVLRRTP
ncbi:dwwA, partial [Symbiodinium sp. KB8]